MDIRCESCGEVVRAGTFCRRCGQPLPEITGEVRPPPLEATGLVLPPGPPTIAAETIAVELAPPPPRRARRRRTLLVVAGLFAVVAAVAGTAAFVLTRPDSEASTAESTPSTFAPPITETSLAPPLGAVPTEVGGGIMAVDPGEPQLISVATCPGLLAVVDAQDCVDIARDGVSYALTLTAVDGGARVEAYVLETGADRITAERQLSGLVPSAGLAPGDDVTVVIFRIELQSGDVFGIRYAVEGDRAPTGSVEFMSPGPDGSLASRAVIAGGRSDVGVDSEVVLVATDRHIEDQSAPTSVIINTIYPTGESWFTVLEALDPDDATQRMNGTVPARDAVTIVLEGPPTTTTTPEPSTTIAADLTTTTVAEPDEAAGPVGLECVGEWITVVASRPAGQADTALSSSPGANVVKNEDSCASLNPRFTSGSYAGEPIYVVYYGPFASLSTAQTRCVELGLFTMNECYVAPLTNDPDDRTIRYGPFD